MGVEPGELQSVRNFARSRKASVQAVLDACDGGELSYQEIDGQRFIVDNEKAAKWQPKDHRAEVEFETRGDITIIHAHGGLMLFNKNQVEGPLMEAIGAGKIKFIFVFGDGTGADSSGMAILTKTALHAVSKQSRVQIVNVHDPVIETLKLTKLDAVVDIRGELEDAIAALG